MKKLKRIPFEGMSNLRDLGGYAAGDGIHVIAVIYHYVIKLAGIRCMMSMAFAVLLT